MRRKSCEHMNKNLLALLLFWGFKYHLTKNKKLGGKKVKRAGCISYSKCHEVVVGILNIFYVASVNGQDEISTNKNKTEVSSPNSLLKRRAVTSNLANVL